MEIGLEGKSCVGLVSYVELRGTSEKCALSPYHIGGWGWRRKLPSLFFLVRRTSMQAPSGGSRFVRLAQ